MFKKNPWLTLAAVSLSGIVVLFGVLWGIKAFETNNNASMNMGYSQNAMAYRGQMNGMNNNYMMQNGMNMADQNMQYGMNMGNQYMQNGMSMNGNMNGMNMQGQMNTQGQMNSSSSSGMSMMDDMDMMMGMSGGSSSSGGMSMH